MTTEEARYHAKLVEKLRAAEAECAKLRAEARRLDAASGLPSLEEYTEETGDANPSEEDALTFAVVQNGMRPDRAAALRSARQHIAATARENDRAAAVMWEYFLCQLVAGSATVGLVETIDQV
jgi:hypothetical protein